MGHIASFRNNNPQWMHLNLYILGFPTRVSGRHSWILYHQFSKVLKGSFKSIYHYLLFSMVPINLVNRPSVAEALLQTALSFIKWPNHASWKYLQNIINPKPLELGTWYFETMFITPCVSGVIYHVSHVTCYVSCSTCHVSYDIITPKLLELEPEILK